MAKLPYLVICRCCKKIIPNGLAKLVLVSQASDLTRNFGKSRKILATRNEPKWVGDRLYGEEKA